MIAEALVGLQRLSDGALARLRQARDGSLVIVPGQGEYQEMARQGLLFSAATAVGGVDPGTAIDTAAPFAVQNPWGSSIDVVILEIGFGFVSGTLGAGFLAACGGASSATATTGTAITAKNGRVGGPPGQALAFTTATLPNTPVNHMVLGSLGAITTTTALAPAPAVYRVGGAIIVPPGATFSVQAVCAAGTSPLAVLSALWAEVPV